MIHSRPGFQTRVTSETSKRQPPPARLRADMEPAFVKHSRAEAAKSNSPLTQTPAIDADRFQAQMQAAADAAFKKMQETQAAQKGPEILVNPAPSATPILTTPHKG